jgi:hypothetical protein
MKFDTLLELTITTTKDMIALLENGTTSNSLGQRVIIGIDSPKTAERLGELFSQASSSTQQSNYAVCIGQYLNQMIHQMDALMTRSASKSNGSAGHEQSNGGVNPKDFFFIPMAPVILSYPSTLSQTQVLGFLKNLLPFLEHKNNNLLNRWHLETSESGEHFSNQATGMDWTVFLPFVKKITPPGEKDSVFFTNSIEDHLHEFIHCQLTPQQLIALQQQHGIKTLEESQFIEALKRLTQPIETDTGRVPFIKKLLSTFCHKEDCEGAFDHIDKILNHKNGVVLTEEEKKCHEALRKITSPYLPIRNLKKLHLKATTTITLESKKPNINGKKADLTRSLCDFSSSFPSEIIELFSEIELRFVLLEESLSTLPRLMEPYDSTDEELICDNLIDDSLSVISEGIKSLSVFAKQPCTTILQCSQLVVWVESAFKSQFDRIIEQLLNLHFRLSTFRLSEHFIRLIIAIKSNCGEKETDYLNNLSHDLKENFLNAFLYSGHYELLLQWLNYFKIVPCTLTSSNAYQYFYGQGVDQHYRCLLAQLVGDLTTARYHADQAKSRIDLAMTLFTNKHDLSLSEAFMIATGSFIDNFALSHLTLASEWLQCGRFTEAAESYGIHRDEISGTESFNKVIRSTNNQFRIKIPSMGPMKTSNPLFQSSLTNIRWCTLRNFLSVKRWLMAHLPNHAKVVVKNGVLTIESNDQNIIRKLSVALEKDSTPFKKNKSQITLSNFDKVKLDTLKSAFGLLDNISETTSTLVASWDRSVVSADKIRYRCLKNMHSKFFEPQERATFELLDRELQNFIIQCQDPLLRLKSLQWLVSLNITQAFTFWAQGETTESERHFTAAKNHAAAARQLFPEHPLLSVIDARINDHADVTTHLLSQSLFQASFQNIQALQNSDKIKSTIFHWSRLGGLHMLLYFDKVQNIRDNLLQRTLCFEPSMYEKREDLLGQATLLAFEFAYELFSQPTLARLEGNTSEVAQNRAHKAYRNLLDTQKLISIKIPAHVESYILVLRCVIEKQHENLAIALLKNALKIAQNNPNLLHQIDIIFRKIEWLFYLNKTVIFVNIGEELIGLLKLLKKSGTQVTKNFSQHLIVTITSYFSQHLAITLNILDCPPRSALKSVDHCFQLQLTILQYLEDAFLRKIDNAEFLSRSIESINALRDTLNNASNIIARIESTHTKPNHKNSTRKFLIANKGPSLTLTINPSNKKNTLSGFELEQLLREDLAFANAVSEIDHFLIPKVFKCQNRLLAHTDMLIAPQSALIGLVVACNQMLNYSWTGPKNHLVEKSELYQCYQLIASETLTLLPKLIPTLFSVLSAQNSADPVDVFQRLTQLISGLNNAHLATGAKITAEHLPLIQEMCARYPDNFYLSYTLFVALSDNTSRTTPCPQAIDACEKAAQAGHPHAEYYYSGILRRGDFGAEIKPDVAQDYLQKSNQQGFYRAQMRLAQLHHSGFFGTSQYNKQAAKIHAKAAMCNVETPQHTKIKLMDRHDIYFLPSQSF